LCWPYDTPLQPVLAQAQALVEAGNRSELMGPMGFVYCEDTRASADAVVSYYAPDPDMDTPRLLPRIAFPVMVFAGPEGKVVADLIEKTEPLADGEEVQLIVEDGPTTSFVTCTLRTSPTRWSSGWADDTAVRGGVDRPVVRPQPGHGRRAAAGLGGDRSAGRGTDRVSQ
jgi:hypothetical protein